MVVHYMRTRKLRSGISKRRGEYRCVCKEGWHDREFITMESGEKHYLDDYSTSLKIITCVGCLNYLIPKTEATLHGMKKRREEAIASAATDPWQTNSESSLSNDILNLNPKTRIGP
jgi:hypothetical protein